MTEDTLLPFDLPAVKRKKVTANFGGGLISSDGDVVLLRGAEHRLGLAETLSGCIGTISVSKISASGSGRRRPRGLLSRGDGDGSPASR